MPFIFLSEQHPLTPKELIDGLFCTKDWSRSYIVKVPHGCAPVWCEYNGDYTDKGHSWTNPISGQVHTTHPLGLTERNGSFFDEFYEIATIEGLTFGEGEAWDPDTNSKFSVEKTDPLYIWNPFFQRYDPPCDNNYRYCEPFRIKYDFANESFDEIFEKNMKLFTNVYCQCCICNSCRKIHTYDCVGNSIRTSDW